MKQYKQWWLAGCVAGALYATPALAQVTAPQMKTFIPAEYPPAAQSAGIEAEVELSLIIEADGTVSKATLTKSGGFGFDEAAIAAAKQFIFVPATQNGVAVRSTVPYRYRFSLAPKGKTANPLASPLDTGSGGPSKDDIGSADLLDALPPGEIRGVILERGARSIVESAQIFITQTPKGTSTPITREALADERGKFSVAGLLPGECVIKVIAIDYETLTTKETVPGEGALEITLRLTPTVEQGYGLLVRGQKEEQEVTRRVVTADELARLPGTQGDVLKGLQNLPGFARAPLDAGLLVVRGSAPQDTQTFLNGMPIPLIYHFGGLTSVVAGDLLTQIDFLPGVYSARYGRGMGGIIDAQTQPGKDNELHGSVKTDIFDTGAYVQGPIGDKGASFAVAGRHSYIDSLLPLSFRIADRVSDQDISTGFTIAPKYGDYQAAVGTKLWGGKGQIIAFGSDDQLKLTVDDPQLGDQFFSSRTLFHRVQGIWSREIAPGLTQRAAISAGITRLSFAAAPIFTFNIDSTLLTGRVDWVKQFSEKLALTYGVDSQLNFFNVSILFPGENNTNVQTELTGNTPDAALYTEARYTPIDGLQIIPGLRADYFGLTDSFTVDPRFAARWQASIKTTLKLGAGIFHQAPQPQDVDATFGNPDVGNQRSEQLSFGFEQTLWKDRLNFDASFYYKHLSELVVQNGSGDSFADITTNDGVGRVRGMELLLRFPPTARFFGWFAYSLARAERKQTADQEEFDLFGFDQTHVVTALASYKVTVNVSVGARFRYSTGTPDTPIIGGIYDADSDSYISLPGETNSERKPAFHQLDIRVDKTFRTDKYSLNAYLEVLNIYNRKNPEAFFYNFDFTQKGTFTGLPILPVLGLKGEF